MQDNYNWSPWVQTYTNRVYPILYPTADDVCLEDIAHALSKITRFGGHTKGDNIYSVAQHAVMVSRHVPAQYAMQALHHDDPEAYIGDVSSPLKRSGFMEGYKEIESRNWKAVAEHFFLDEEIHESVHEADLRALVTEQRDLMGKPPRSWSVDVEPFPESIYVLTPKQAKENYLRRHYELEAGRVEMLIKEFHTGGIVVGSI